MIPTKIPLSKRLSFRVASQLLAVVLLALALNAYLNYSNFDKTQRQLAESRILVSSGDVKRSISGAIDLGLSLGEIANLQEIIGVGLVGETEAGIIELSVLDTAGNTVASTAADPGIWNNVGSWPIKHQQKDILRSLATDRFALGIPLINPFSVQVGWLIVVYDGSQQLAARSTMRTIILRDFAMSAALAALLIMVGASVLTNSFVKTLFERCTKKSHVDGKLFSRKQNEFTSFVTTYQNFMRQTGQLLREHDKTAAITESKSNNNAS